MLNQSHTERKVDWGNSDSLYLVRWKFINTTTKIPWIFIIPAVATTLLSRTKEIECFELIKLYVARIVNVFPYCMPTRQRYTAVK